MKSLSRTIGAGLLLLGCICSQSMSLAQTKTKSPKSTTPLKAEAWSAPEDLAITSPKTSFDPDVTFACQDGPFVALGKNGIGGDTRSVFDLRDGKSVGDIKTDLKLDKPFALSHDGKYFAGRVRFGKEMVVVFDVASGEKVKEIPNVKPEHLLIADGKTLIIVGSVFQKTLGLYNIETGKKIIEAPFNVNVSKSPPVLNHDGTLFGIAAGDRGTIYNASTGKVVKNLPQLKSNGATWNFEAIAFSPDSQQIVSLVESSRNYRLTGYALEGSNKEQFNFEIDAPKNVFYEGPKLLVGQDNTSYLISGEAIYDREAKSLLWRIPEEGIGSNKTPRMIVKAEQVIGYKGGRGLNAEKQIVSFGMSKEDVTAMRDAVKSGGSAIDGKLPALKQGIVKGAKEKEVPLAGCDWIAKVAAPTKMAKVATRPIPVPVKPNQVESLRITGGEKPRAIIELADRVTPFASQKADPSIARRVERVELITGRTSGKLALPQGLMLLNASQDGTLAFTTDITEERRVDVWNMESGQAVASFRPYADEKDKDRKVAFAGAISAEEFITVSATGKIIAWNIADLRANWITEIPQLTNVQIVGNFLIGNQRSMIRFVDLTSGDPVGDLEGPKGGDDLEPTKVAIRPDLQEAVAFYCKQGKPTRMLRWALKSGKMEEDIETYFTVTATTPVAYAGLNHVLINHRDLIDLNRHDLVWNYQIPLVNARFATTRPDGRTWLISQPAGAVFNATESVIVAADLPEPELAAYIKQATDGAESLLKPGMSIAISMELQGEQAGTVKAKILESLKKTLQARGIKVDDNAPNFLTVTARERDTGEKIQYRDFGGPGGPFNRRPQMTGLTVRVLEIELTSTLTSNGAKVWSSKPEKIGMRTGFGPPTLVPGDVVDLQQYLHQQLWQRTGDMVVNSMPRYIARTSEGVIALPGSSTLDASGIKTSSPVQKK
jgi:hypothetical protein